MLINGTLRVFDRGEVGVLRGVVRLEDITLADAPSRIIATTPIMLERHQESGRFEIPVGTNLDSRAQYALSARLEGEHGRTGLLCVFGTVASHPWQPHQPTQGQLIDVRPWN